MGQEDPGEDNSSLQDTPGARKAISGCSMSAGMLTFCSEVMSFVLDTLSKASSES